MLDASSRTRNLRNRAARSPLTGHLLLHPLHLKSLPINRDAGYSRHESGLNLSSRRSSHQCKVASQNHLSSLASSSFDFEPSPKEVLRRQTLKNLLRLRGVYRDVLSANAFLNLPSPVYKPPDVYDVSREGETAASDPLAAEAGTLQPSREDLEREKSYKALMLVAEMQLLADRLRVRKSLVCMT